MASFETITLEKGMADHIARITLNRPDRLNAISRQMEEELGEAIEEVDRDGEARVLVVTGAGKAFCSGADARAMAGGQEAAGGYAARGAEEVRQAFRGAQRIILGLQRMEKPTIAMVNGAAVGAGMDIACACDIRVGSPSARFMVAYIRIGLFPGWGGTWLYPRVMGLSKAAEMLFTADFMEAEEAHRVGLLNRLVPQEELESATMEMARRIAEGPPVALRLAKMMLYKGLEFDLETAMKMAAAAETITLTSEDHREGVAAFREKRKPSYGGR